MRRDLAYEKANFAFLLAKQFLVKKLFYDGIF